MGIKVYTRSDTPVIADGGDARELNPKPESRGSSGATTFDGQDEPVKKPWTEKPKLEAGDISGTPSTYPTHLAAIFAERPDLESRWQLLHTWLSEPQKDAVESAKYETYESINEDHDMPKLQVMLTFLHGQLGADGLKAFVSDTVKRLAEISGKQDARTLLDQWPTQRWGDLPDRAALEAIAAG